MKFNQKICIVSDLDGTLLPSTKIPLERDLQAIRRFEEAGGVFTIATGRTVQASAHYAGILQLKSPMIVFNGGMFYHPVTEEKIIIQALPDEAKAMTQEVFQEKPEIGIEVLCAEDTWVVNNTEYEQLHVKICGITPQYSTIPEINGTWLKVLFAMSPDEMPDFIRYIESKHFHNVDFIRSEKKFYEMLPKGNSKGSALTQYRTLPGMEGFKIIAVGDYDNDLEMLKASDFSVCPANAAEIVKNTADLQLSRTCEEGAMEELIDKILNQEIAL